MKVLNILSRTEVGSNLDQPRTKNIRVIDLGADYEDESDAKIFSVPDSETGQQSAPHIQLELMPRQPRQAYKGTLIEFLSKIILTVTTSVTWLSKFSAAFLQLQYASAQL